MCIATAKKRGKEKKAKQKTQDPEVEGVTMIPKGQTVAVESGVEGV